MPKTKVSSNPVQRIVSVLEEEIGEELYRLGYDDNDLKGIASKIINNLIGE